jgi:hypothetical protein
VLTLCCLKCIRSLSWIVQRKWSLEFATRRRKYGTILRYEKCANYPPLLATCQRLQCMEVFSFAYNMWHKSNSLEALWKQMIGLKIEVPRLWGVGKEHDVTMHAWRRTPLRILSKTFRKFANTWVWIDNKCPSPTLFHLKSWRIVSQSSKRRFLNQTYLWVVIPHNLKCLVKLKPCYHKSYIWIRCWS